jgi:2,6-dihydroxypyridine 3-monooxygenase
VTTYSVQIIGGSLGGLSAACLLRDAGHRVELHERSPSELEERGAGIGFLPASYRYLVERAGIDLEAISVPTRHIRYLGRDGALLHDAEHHYRFSSWNTVYRSLLAHLRRIDAGAYQLGSELLSVEQTADAVIGTYGDGSTRSTDLLIGADGIGSTVRRHLHPDVAPQYAGYVAWRGTCPETALDPETRSALSDAITYHVGTRSHILAYPIPALDGAVGRGDRLMNFVWYRNYAPGADLEDLLEDREGRRRKLSVPPGMMADRHLRELHATARAHLPPLLARVVDATEQPFVQVIFDLEVPSMVAGRTCLLGDAAFAVRPHAAAGTAKAADDAWQLAHHLSSTPDLATALGRFEATQLDLGRRLLARTREVGNRSQVLGTFGPGDPEATLGLHSPGN